MDFGKGKHRMMGKVVKREAEIGGKSSDDDEHQHMVCVEGDIETNKKKKVLTDGAGGRRGASGCGGGGGASGCGGGGGGGMRMCQADKCVADLSEAKPYHKRHKVCELHSKAQVVLVAGIRQRFCQQCSRFHDLSEFDETKRSCRRRLAGHNERRRKNATESHAEGSSHPLKEMVCGQVDERARIKNTVQENGSFKHFQIR